MATRAECDGFYRRVGYEAFDPAIDPDEVLRRAALLPERLAGDVRRASAVARMADPQEYFDVSEYATSPQAIAAMTGNVAHAGTLLLAVLPTWTENPQRPLALHIIRPHGHVHLKLVNDARYCAFDIKDIGKNLGLRLKLQQAVGNLPAEMIELLVGQAEGYLLCPLTLEEGFMELPLAEHGAAAHACAMYYDLSRWLMSGVQRWGK